MPLYGSKLAASCKRCMLNLSTVYTLVMEQFLQYGTDIATRRFKIDCRVPSILHETTLKNSII